MHMGHSEFAHAEKTVSVTFHLDDPHALTDTDQAVWELKAAKGQPLVSISIEHADRASVRVPVMCTSPKDVRLLEPKKTRRSC